MKSLVKEKNIIYTFLVVTLTFAFSTCVNNLIGTNEGIITINFGGSNANIAYNGRTTLDWPPSDEMKAVMEYSVKLIQNGDTVYNHNSTGNSTISISIKPGIYTIIVDAEFDNKPYATGSRENIEVKAGQRNPVSINMRPYGTDEPDDSEEPVIPEEPVFNITMENDGYGTATATPSAASASATVTISAVPDMGYGFDRWVVVSENVTLLPNTTNPASFIMPEGDVTIKAEFVPLSIQTPYLVLSPVPVNFGALPLGYNQPAAQTITITNTGNTAADDISIAIIPTGLFTLPGTLPTTVAAESTASFTVQPNENLTVGTHSATITVTYNGGTITNATATTSANFTVYLHIDDLQEAINNASQSAVFILSSGTMTNPGITIPANKEIILMPGSDDVILTRPTRWSTVYNQDVPALAFVIEAGGRLVLLPNEDKTLTIRGNNNGQSGDPLILVNTGGELVINDGVLITTTQENSNSAITVNGGRLTMTGGRISEHIRNGPVRIQNGGSFDMSGGIITGNRQSQTTQSIPSSMVTVVGAGSSFTMSGNAEISSNRGMTRGGAVWVTSGGTFSMISGTIRDNRTDYEGNYPAYGGGVYVANGGIFNKTGGIIYGREVGAPNWNRLGPTHGNWPGQGAAVYCESGSKFRDITSNATHIMDSSIAGPAGGWE